MNSEWKGLGSEFLPRGCFFFLGLRKKSGENGERKREGEVGSGGRLIEMIGRGKAEGE
jgi:hypothetical protein